MKQKKIQLAIADERQSVIDELLSLINTQDFCTAAFTTQKPQEIMDLLHCIQVDILLIGFSMLYSEGKELVKKLKDEYPRLKILTLSAREQEAIVQQLLAQGEISGNIFKPQHTGAAICPPDKSGDNNAFCESLMQEISKAALLKKENKEKHLTERELEVIRLIDREYTNKKIAEVLFISERTVETHRKNIFRKTKTNNVIGLIKYAYEHKLV